MPQKNSAQSGMSMAAKGASREKGSNETVIHCRLAMAKDTTIMAMGRPMVQLQNPLQHHSVLPFSRSRNSLPVLKNGTRLASTSTAPPVRGLRPVRALARLDRKGAEAPQFDAVAVLHGADDFIEDRVDNALNVAVIKMGVACPRSFARVRI